MKRTMLVSAFAGCGKTWLVKNQEQFTFTMRDSDSSSYEKTNNWPTNYVNDIMDEIKTGEFDFIFICQTERVIDELDRRSIPYVIVEPDNMTYRADRSDRKEKRQLVKQQWFGRFVLRDNSHIADFPEWLNHINEIYDERTGVDFLNSHKQVSFFLLDSNQYLSDIIKELYWKKEHYDIYVANLDQ